jgi:hypothetical protein
MKQLVRLHRWKLNEKRQKLAELEDLAAKMRLEVDRLDKKMDAESEAARASAEIAVAYPAYVSAMLDRRKRLDHSIAEVELSVAKARQDVTDAFHELKRYELAMRNREQREQAKMRRREQAQTDAQGAAVHRRQAAVS